MIIFFNRLLEITETDCLLWEKKLKFGQWPKRLELQQSDSIFVSLNVVLGVCV